MALESEDLSAPCKDKLGLGRGYGPSGMSHLGLLGSGVALTEYMRQGRLYSGELKLF